MDMDVEYAYKQVYEELGIYRNEGKGLWQGRTFCIVGFEHEIQSGADLIKCIISALIVRGASVMKFPNEKLGHKVLSIIDFYVCNYSMGYNALGHDILETKLVTPIWLYTCNRDSQIYDTRLLPIFMPVSVFWPLMFSQEDVTVYIINGMGPKCLRNSSDILSRFARHCGFKTLRLGETIADATPHGRTYVVMGRPLDKTADAHIISFVNKHKHICVSVQWMMDSYLKGEIEDVNKYLVDVDFEATVVGASKKGATSSIDGTIAHCIREKRVICLSYAAAIESTEEVREMIRASEVKIHVVNPLYLLAPWAVEHLSARERNLYNNLTLLEPEHILLYISKHEARNGAFGIFAQISMCMEYSKFRSAKRLRHVRNIEIHPLHDLYASPYQGMESAVPIPQELLAGESLVFRGRTRSFNLYDLADSIEYLGEDNALLEEEEMLGPDIHIRRR
ncbi:DNA topoisomerase 2-binding 1 isoform X3, putative [Babesia ovis]|uniref:DNA topoisomerase 2-binding 1 isoform X3, putative n=1 Tax=Babesia ovis TaxID=5869 RepID=A0A9W5TD14_BABOV|nr:DNA topoisomerase 2-binding 1 isoform X3, putative [Babesia ovis]